MQIQINHCTTGDIFPLSNVELMGMQSHRCAEITLNNLAVGTKLSIQGQEIFRVVGRALLPAKGRVHMQSCPLLKSFVPLDEGKIDLEPSKHGYALAWITLSDKGFVGEREDTSGPAIGRILGEHIPVCHEQGFILPDHAPSLQTLLTELSHGQGYNIICTTGGTGLGERDVAVEASLAVIEKRLQGFEQVMMQASLSKTPNAAISRAIVGTIGKCLLINLPGSQKAVQENLIAILASLPHALAKLNGDTADCATVS